MQTKHTAIYSFITIVNNEPQIALNVTRDITVNSSNPTRSTSWIQVQATVTDNDADDKLSVKIYFGTKAVDSLNNSDLIVNQTNVTSRNSFYSKERQLANGASI